MKKILAICLSLVAVQAFGQSYNDRSTTGRVPPKGVNVVGYVSTAKAASVQQLITGVPAYLWKDGCGPTVVGMLCGYYDSHGFPNIFPGDASTQTTAVNNAIASTEHYNDYAIPVETALPVQPDKSELPLGDEHISNCIADFMGTSFSIKGNIYGWSLGVDIKPSWENYIATFAPDYVATATQYYYNDISIWDTIVSNVDRNKPMLLLVDTEGDGLTDHFVIVNGYKNEGGINYYGCFNTWDTVQHWYEFAQMAVGTQWGIARCYTFSIHHKLPVPAGTIAGSSSVCIGTTPVVYTVPLIDDATSYAWTIPPGATGSSTTNTISIIFGSGSASGSITVKGQNANGDGTASSLAITVNPTPSAPTVGSITQPTCSVSTGSVVLSGLPSSGTWTLTRNPGGITYQGTGSGTTISGLPPGTYTFTVASASSCISASSAGAFIDANPATPAAPVVGTITAPTCSVATGTVSLSSLPVSGTWTLTRTPGNITKTGTGTSTSISGLSPGTYSFTVTNALGCTSSSSSSVVIADQPATPPLPVAVLTQPTCSLSTGTITVTSPKETGMTYSIDGTTYINTTGIFNSVAPGTYTLTAKNSSGCISGGTSLTINNQPSTPPIPSVTVGQPDCSISTGTITVTSPTGTGFTYSINGTTYTNTTGIFTAVPSGTYTVTVRNSSGCISPGTTVLIVAQPATPAAPVATLTQPSCTLATGTISVTSPTGAGYTYSINGTTYNNTTGIFTAVPSGTYTVTVRNSSGCTSQGTSVLILAQPVTPAAPVATITQPSCTLATGTISITSPTAPGMTYSINGTTYSNTTGIFTAVAPGAYTLTAKSSGGCISAVTSATINQQPAKPSSPVGSLVQPDCTVPTGVIDISSPKGTGYSYSINGTDYSNVTGQFTGVTPGSYTVTAKNQAGCISSGTNATINPQPAIPPAPVITQTDNILHSSAASGNTWYNQNGIIGNATGQEYTVAVSGIYYVIVTLDVCSSPPSNSLNVIYTGSENTSSSVHKTKAYPNPFENELVIERSGNNDVAAYEIFNALGQVVMEGQASEKTTVVTSALPRGIYVLRVRSGLSPDQIKIIRK